MEKWKVIQIDGRYQVVIEETLPPVEKVLEAWDWCREEARRIKALRGQL